MLLKVKTKYSQSGVLSLYVGACHLQKVITDLPQRQPFLLSASLVSLSPSICCSLKIRVLFGETMTTRCLNVHISSNSKRKCNL